MCLGFAVGFTSLCGVGVLVVVFVAMVFTVKNQQDRLYDRTNELRMEDGHNIIEQPHNTSRSISKPHSH